MLIKHKRNGPSLGESWGRSQGGTMPHVGMTLMWATRRPLTSGSESGLFDLINRYRWVHPEEER